MTGESAQLTALLAHGKGYETPLPEDPTRVRVRFDARLTAEAAGILYSQGDGPLSFDRIILSGGQTSGPGYPSEAATMRDVLRQRFDESRIPDEAILLEEESFDTATNITRVNELCEEQDIGRIALLTMGYHLPRTRRLAERLSAVPVVAAYKSDEIVGQDRGVAGHFYARQILRRTVDDRSIRPLAETAYSYALEGAAWGLLLVDPSGEGISGRITARLRHQPANY